MDITDNMAEVQQRILRAAAKSGRNASEIKLLAVSKNKPVSDIEVAYQNGQRIFAENRVQELMQKVPILPKDCEWHLIGQLQTNKVKYLDERIALLHSLDRFKLLAALEEQGLHKNHVWPTLVQVNIANDPAKAGLKPDAVEDFLISVADHPHVEVWGFMTIGSLGAIPEETRGYFRELRLLRDKLATKNFKNVHLQELSMGMSQDFEIAIEEGATMVRVGRHIFGER